MTETEKEMQTIREAATEKDLQKLDSLPHHLRSSWRNDVGAVSGCRNFGAVACALHAGALGGWNKKSVEDSAAGGSVNGTALTGTNYAELAVGFRAYDVLFAALTPAEPLQVFLSCHLRAFRSSYRACSP